MRMAMMPSFLVLTPQWDYDGFIIEGPWKETYDITRNGQAFAIYRNQQDGRDDGLGTEPQLERRQELSNGSRGHNEKSPKIWPNLTRFAYDRINGHNPRQSLGNSTEPMRA